MSRADEPTTLPEGDDEITTDVDPSWVAGLRAGASGSAPSPTAPDADPVGDDVDDWALTEPHWDPEATVGVSDGLIERIRQEVRSTPPSLDAPPAVPARPAPPPPIPEQQRPAASATGSAVHQGPPAVGAPAPIAQAGPSVEDLASTTVRWEPRQRLAATAPITDTVLIAPQTHHGLDRTKVVIALIVAVALVIVVWLVAGSLGSDDPAPSVGSVPTSGSTDGTDLPVGSTPVGGEAPVEVGG